MTESALTQRQQDVLVFIEKTVGERGYPPSVREIGQAVGLASPSTVHSHLHTLQRLGYLPERDQQVSGSVHRRRRRGRRGRRSSSTSP